MISSSKKSQIFKYVNIILTVAVFYFAFIYGKKLLSESSFSETEFNYIYLFISILMFFLFYVILAIHWLLICRQFDEFAKRDQILVFFASQPYKYLPTSLFTLSFRAKFAKQVGMSLRKSSAAQLVENFNIILSGILLSVLIFVAISNILYFLLTTLLLLLVYFVIPQVFNVKIKSFEKKISKKQFTRTVIIAGVGWIISGVGLYFAGLSIGTSPGLAGAVIANTLAYIAGILVIFSPGGIGVRELVFSVFAIGAPVIVLWRFITFISDMILGFGASAVLKLRGY